MPPMKLSALSTHTTFSTVKMKNTYQVYKKIQNTLEIRIFIVAAPICPTDPGLVVSF